MSDRWDEVRKNAEQGFSLGTVATLELLDEREMLDSIAKDLAQRADRQQRAIEVLLQGYETIQCGAVHCYADEVAAKTLNHAERILKGEE